MPGLSPNLKKMINKQSTSLLETGSRFQRFDQLRQRHFWSSYYFAPDVNGYINSGNYPIFVIPSGQNGQGFPSGVTLTDRETNWKSQNRVPDNQNFEITEIGVSLGMITADVFDNVGNNFPQSVAVPPRVANQFINNTLVSITYLTNTVPLGLVADFAQCSAPTPGTTRNLDAQNYLYRSNGFAAPALRRRFKIPILLQHGETFSFQFQIPRSFFIGTNAIAGISPFVARFDFWATESYVEKS